MAVDLKVWSEVWSGALGLHMYQILDQRPEQRAYPDQTKVANARRNERATIRGSPSVIIKVRQNISGPVPRLTGKALLVEFLIAEIGP